MIDRLHQQLARRHAQHGRVVRRVEADHQVLLFAARQVRQGSRQHLGPDLRPTSAAAHRRLRIRRHAHFGVHAHPAPVDPVFPAPHHRAGQRQPVSPRHRPSAAEAQNDQGLALRPPALQLGDGRRGAGSAPGPRPARTAQTPAFGPRRALDRRAIARREHRRVADAAQCRVDLHAAFGIAGEPGMGQECGRLHSGRPQAGGGIEETAVRQRQPAVLEVPAIAPRTISTEASTSAETATRRADSGASTSGSGVPDTSAIR